MKVPCPECDQTVETYRVEGVKYFDIGINGSATVAAEALVIREGIKHCFSPRCKASGRCVLLNDFRLQLVIRN